MRKALTDLLLTQLRDAQPFTPINSGTCFILGAPKEDPGAIREALEQLVQLGEISEFQFDPEMEPPIVLVSKAAS